MLHVHLSACLKVQTFIRIVTGIWLRTPGLVGSWSDKILLNYLYIWPWTSYPLNRQERTACYLQMICSRRSFTVGALTIVCFNCGILSHYIKCLHLCSSPFCNSNRILHYAWPILLALVLWPAVIWTDILGSDTRAVTSGLIYGVQTPVKPDIVVTPYYQLLSYFW